MSNHIRATSPGTLAALLHIAGAVGVAFIQPGYDLLSHYPEFFVARKIDAMPVVIAVVVMSLAIPLVLWLALLAMRLVSRPLAKLYLATVIGVCGGAVVVQLLKSGNDPSGILSLLLGGAVAVAVSFAYLRIQVVSSFCSLLSPAAIVFPTLFLFFSPVSKTLFPPPDESLSGEVIGPEISSTTPVVFIVFDELPTASLMAQDRSIDTQAFPAFAALAQNANWYRNATTVAAGSLNAIPAILTGRYPNHTYIPSAIDYPENVFSLLGNSYSVLAQEPITALCPPVVCSLQATQPLHESLPSLGRDLWVIYQHLLLPEKYTESLPAINENWMGFTDEPAQFEPVEFDKRDMTGAQIVHEIKKQSKERVIAASGKDYGASFEEALLELSPGKTQFLHFQHIQLPHVPWRYLPSGQQYRDMFVDGKEGNDKWIDEQPWLMAQCLQRHMLQVKYVDGLLGKLLSRLKEIDAYDDALIIVTADHGASFKMGALRRTTTQENMAEIAGVPLFVKLPGQRRGQVIEDFVETVDIVPTIADVLNIEAPWEMDGYSLLDDAAPRDRKINVRSIYGQPMYLEQTDLQQREWLLNFKTEWFGADNEIKNLFAFGRGRDYVGRATDSLNADNDQGIRANLNRPAQYAQVYLHIPYSPSRVLGRIESTDQPMANNRTLLVGINGVIHGAGQLFTKNKEDGHFSVMVPSAPFQAGANEVTLYLLDESHEGKLRVQQVNITEAE